MSRTADTDLAMRHARARETHEQRQRAEGLRHAARVLSADLPTGDVQRATVENVIKRLRLDAAELERSTR